jgi:hypothetical protein
VVDTLHFLKEEDVGRHSAQLVAQFMDDHSPAEVGEALVDVERRDGELHGLGNSRGPANSSGNCRV